MMEWLAMVVVVVMVGWNARNAWQSARRESGTHASVETVAKAHEAELAARREAVACLSSLIRQRESNVCLWEALGEYSQMLADTMGVAEEFGASEGMAFLAGEMGGERWSRIVGLAEKAKR